MELVEMSDDTNTGDDIDLSLLERNLDDIEDLPSFEVPPKGTYQFLVSGLTKKVNEKPAVAFDLEVINTIELQDKTEKPVVDGSKTGVLFFLDNEFGLGNMKKFLAPFAAHFGTNNVKELVKEKIQNVQVTCTLDHQKDKQDPTKVYARPKNIVVIG
jgi:hypothetical protein